MGKTSSPKLHWPMFLLYNLSEGIHKINLTLCLKNVDKPSLSYKGHIKIKRSSYINSKSNRKTVITKQEYPQTGDQNNVYKMHRKKKYIYRKYEFYNCIAECYHKKVRIMRGGI